jgi:hypothetical protein
MIVSPNVQISTTTWCGRVVGGENEMKKSFVIAGILVAALSVALVQAYALPVRFPNQPRTNNTMSSNHMNGSCSMNGNGMMNGSMMGGSMMNGGQSMNHEQCQQYMGQSHSMTQEQCQGMM